MKSDLFRSPQTSECSVLVDPKRSEKIRKDPKRSEKIRKRSEKIRKDPKRSRKIWPQYEKMQTHHVHIYGQNTPPYPSQMSLANLVGRAQGWVLGSCFASRVREVSWSG